jgi:hypothetical protein
MWKVEYIEHHIDGYTIPTWWGISDSHPTAGPQSTIGELVQEIFEMNYPVA